jgi:imidazolonepropionase-like amidohydrolase
MERRLGRLAPGYYADLSIVEGDRVAATAVGGRLTWRRA